MARFGIISAMPVELEGLIKEYDAKELTVKGFYKIYKGKIGENEVFMACSGIGKVNAAACTQKLIDFYEVEYIVNMGIAGGIARELKTLDVVVGSEVFYHDFTPDRLLENYHPFTRMFKCDEKLIEAAKKVCEATPTVEHYFVDKIATGDCFVESAETKAKILELGGRCCEMEGAAIGHVAYLNGVAFLIIRSISDLADEDAEISYEEFERKAAQQANRIVAGILKLLA